MYWQPSSVGLSFPTKLIATISHAQPPEKKCDMFNVVAFKKSYNHQFDTVYIAVHTKHLMLISTYPIYNINSHGRPVKSTTDGINGLYNATGGPNRTAVEFVKNLFGLLSAAYRF